VKNSAADYDIAKCIREGYVLDSFQSEIIQGGTRREHCRKATNTLDGFRVGLGSENFKSLVARAQEVNEVAARADAPTQQLIEQVNIDLAELFGEVRH
jgi:hypothetical protein